jgi:hypothetical protein
VYQRVKYQETNTAYAVLALVQNRDGRPLRPSQTEVLDLVEGRKSRIPGEAPDVSTSSDERTGLVAATKNVAATRAHVREGRFH